MVDSFKIAFASCLNTTDSGAFDRIRLLAPDYFYGAGDLWYDDGSSDHVAHWNAFFAAPKVAAMVAALPNPPIVGWSDHDFGFAANATAGAITTTANSAYRTKFPSLPLPSQGIYRTWTRGRVRFVLCDERSFKSANSAADDASKTVLGATQKAWLKNLLTSNAYSVIVVLGDTPWVGAATAGDDGWKGYATEREELRQAYAASPAQIIRLNGDMHCLAAGRDQFGIDRVWQAAPLRNNTKVKDGGAGYTTTYPTNANEGAVEELFGLVTIDDTDSQITCTYRGYSSDGTQRLTDSLVVPTGGSGGLSLTFPYAGFPDGVGYPNIPTGTTTVTVTSSASLSTALTNAAAGQRILLGSGTYSGAFTLSGKNGSSSAGITIEAATPGAAIFASGSTITIRDSSYVTLKGLAFPYELSAGNTTQLRGTSHHCRITRCTFGPTSVGTSGANKTPFIYGGDTVEFIRIDHNEFRNKANPGNAVLFDGNFSTNQVVKHIRVDHNLWRSIKPEVTNEKEPIRFGVSTMSKSSSFSVIERNVFVDCICEPENISVKAGNVRVSGNTVLRSIGGIVYRHGLNGIVSDNYIIDRVDTFGTTIGSGGFRFYDANHEISYNYVDSIHGGNFQQALILDTGDAEGSSTNLAGHWRVVNALVERNVIVGCPQGITIGDNYDSAPTGCTIRDNIAAAVASGVAITQKIAPVSTTIGSNPYYASPATGGMVQGGDTIWRKAGYGPRLTYLQQTDVGPNADLGDTDGTGVLADGSGGGGTVDDGTAATKFGWGTPLGPSDEFEYTGAPTSTKWGVYNGPGHDGNGVRSPARVTVANGKMILTGLANGDSAGLEHKFDQQYGRWEVRCRSVANAASNGNDYHPVLILWTDVLPWPTGGEIDFLENGAPGQAAPEAYWHYPHPEFADGHVEQIHFTGPSIDLTQFHNFGIEWTPDGLVGYVDGVEWCRASGGARTQSNGTRENIQDLRTAHLTVQLDNFDGTNQTPATMEVEWARVYSLTPSGPIAGAQTVTAVGIPTAEAFGIPLITGASPARPPGAVDTLLGQNSIVGTATLGYTVGANPGPPGNQTVRAVGIPTAAAFGVPVVTQADGPLAITATGIVSAEAFGRPTVLLGPAPDPAPGGVLVPSLWAVGADGTSLTPLPRWISIKLSPVRNSAGSLQVVYPAGAPGFDLLHDNVSASPLRALEIRVWLGGSQEGALGGWLVQKSGDDLTPGSEWTFSGHFHEWLLSKALVYPQAISAANTSGALTFAGATAGLILSTLMDQAQARGALPLMSRDFTTTHDSNGAPWAKAISSMKLAPATTTVAQVADKLVELDMVEYEVTAGRVWRAWNPGGRGTDRTAPANGPTPLTFSHARNLAQHTRRESVRDAGTAVLVAGSEGFYESASSATAQAQLGWRAEVGVSAGQLNSRSAVQAVAPSYLEGAASGTAEYAAAVEFGPRAPIPLIEYGVGDWAYTVADTVRRRLRIAHIELIFARDKPADGKVVFNDLITDRVTALYRRLNAISTGEAVVGTSESTPGGTGEDINPPAAPQGITVASTFAYQVPGETATLAEVGVGWAPVINDAYVDTETAGKARLSALLARRIRGGVSQASVLASDWTFYGAPDWAATYAPLLKKEWEDDPSGKDADANGVAPNGLINWLEAYEPAHRGGGAVTGDTAQYVVQYQYLGATGLGDFIGDQPGTDGFWSVADGSPTSQDSLVFGNVEGGRAVGVRVAAVDRTGNQGPWSDVVAVDTAADDQPPPAPSKPGVQGGFRIIRVTWDGKGSSGEDMVAAAPDFLSGGGVEIHVAQGIDFTPDRPFGPAGKVDLSLSQTYQQVFYDAGTLTLSGFENEQTYFVRLVAIDRNGNPSEPSETSDPVTPNKLVTIDYGPDTIDRATIRNAAIGSAEIDLLAVNESHIGSVNASSIVTGIMTADITNAGRFATPMSATGNQVEFDSAGIRLRQGNTVVGRWQTADASMLMTGTYLSALSGERINLLPDGTARWYGAAGVDYASIENVGGIVQMRSRADSNGRRSYVDFNPVGTRVWYGTPGAERSKMDLGETYGVITAPVTGVRIWRHIPATDGTAARFHFVTATAAGDDSASIVHYQRVTAASNHAYLFGATSDAGIVFDAGFIGVTHNNISPADIHAANFVQVSAIAAKRDIAPVRFGGVTARGIAQAARAKSFYYHSEFEPRADRPDAWLQRFDDAGEPLPDEQAEWTHPPRRPVMHVGPMADDLLAVAPEIVHRDLPQRGPAASGLGLGVGTVAGLAYAGVGELADEIDELKARVQRLTERLDPPLIVIDEEPRAAR